MGWLDTLSGLGNLGMAAYDIYSGINSMNQANKYQNMMFGNMQSQNEFAEEMWDRLATNQWPLEDLQAAYAKQDLEKLRPLQTAQRDYGISRGLADIAVAKELDPMLDQTKKDLVSRLAEGEDVLAARMRNTASTDVAAAFDKQRATDTRRFAALGINPNSGATQNYMSRMGTSQALSEAGARTQASRQAEDTALSRNAQALNYRAGIPLSQQQYTSSITPNAALAGLSTSTQMAGGLWGALDKSSSDSLSGANYAYNQALRNFGVV